MYALWDNPNIKFHVCTTRFNNQTLIENKLGRLRIQKKALYCSMRPIKDTYRDDYLFILELNNEENEISGIAVVDNIPSDVVYRIYSDENYNHYFYCSNYYIAKENVKENELAFWTKLEMNCFYGKSHLKRGHNIMQFPSSMIESHKKNGIDVIEILKQMFRVRVREPAVP